MGLILTIGYLVLEAASVLVIDGDNRIYPASVVGFDHATGFGLLRAKPAPTCAPVELGDSSALSELQGLVVAGHEGVRWRHRRGTGVAAAFHRLVGIHDR